VCGMAYAGPRRARSPVWTRYEDRTWDRRRPKSPVFAGSLTVRPDIAESLLRRWFLRSKRLSSSNEVPFGCKSARAKPLDVPRPYGL
jgi:hypothetical protein